MPPGKSKLFLAVIIALLGLCFLFSVKFSDFGGDKGIMESATHTPGMREGAAKVFALMVDPELDRPILDEIQFMAKSASSCSREKANFS
jgi:hypothetical protein